MRWTHPVRGDVPPSVFIPIAEETGLIIALGEWALNRACVEANSWPHGVKVAVNLSPIQFRERGLALQVVAALAKSGLQASRLELEVTERLLLEDNDSTLATMQQLNTLGVIFRSTILAPATRRSLPAQVPFHRSRSTVVHLGSGTATTRAYRRHRQPRLNLGRPWCRSIETETAQAGADQELPRRPGLSVRPADDLTDVLARLSARAGDQKVA